MIGQIPMERGCSDIPIFDYHDITLGVSDGFWITGSKPVVDSVPGIFFNDDFRVVSFFPELCHFYAFYRRWWDVDVKSNAIWQVVFNDYFCQHVGNFGSKIERTLTQFIRQK